MENVTSCSIDLTIGYYEEIGLHCLDIASQIPIVKRR
jgi:hypothetical protein